MGQNSQSASLMDLVDGFLCRWPDPRDITGSAFAEQGVEGLLDRAEITFLDQQEGDLDIHFVIIQGSKNRTLSDMLCADLYHLVRMYRYRFSSAPKRPQKAFAEHHRIVEAIADRDGELAEMLMRRHISASRRNIERRMLEQRDAITSSGGSKQ